MDSPAPSPGTAASTEDIRTGHSVETLKQAFLDHLHYGRGRHFASAKISDQFLALAGCVRDRLMTHWIDSVLRSTRTGDKFVYYLSAEFLMGPQLGNNLVNLHLSDSMRRALYELGINIDDLIRFEEEPGLGNGGLGRLAACYMDSLATLDLPSVGYGIRYEFGMFDQEIRDGWQVEITDKWLRWGNPWEIERPERSYEVSFGGATESYVDGKGGQRVRWNPDRRVRGTAHDMPVLGYGARSASILRLWKAEAVESFDFAAFNAGDYARAVDAKLASENISKVLYPNDNSSQGKQLRLEQQHFFVSCSIQDALHRHLTWGGTVADFGRRNSIQLNDTHPSIAVAELMRILMDQHAVGWDDAWEITREATAYTNHTLLPEALEKWPLPLFARLLPRHLEIIYEINRRFLDEVRARFPGDEDRVRRMSLIGEDGEKQVRMAHLATVGSHSVNGVAELHSDLLRRTVLRDFHEMFPDRLKNVTNGVTPRRWVVLGNPDLTALINGKIGTEWPGRMEDLRRLETFLEDRGFRDSWRAIRLRNKERLAATIKDLTGTVVDPGSQFSIQVKRIHEYKRQHLNALHILTCYLRMKRDPGRDHPARTFVFGGKAAPGYYEARRIIKLITSIAELVNDDSDVAGRLKVVFLPDFNVRLAQSVYPAADLSVQISTAGKEASGTGNMKFMMNGAVTIGTLDGANVEILEEVGAENFFLFGRTADEVEALRASGYRPRAFMEENPELGDVLNLLTSGAVSRGDCELFKPLVDTLLDHDPFMLLADYASFIACQDRVEEAWKDVERWTSMSILNMARSGRFSSDRSIRDYCERIWKVEVPEH